MYDNYFMQFAKLYFTMENVDWKWFKAQGIAESNLDPDAKSQVGARGIMQIMPGTYEDIKKANKLVTGDITEPKYNIMAGIYYDRRMWDNWNAKGRAQEDRLRFMFASYNAGIGNVLKAQKLSPNKLTWTGVKPYLQMVTGESNAKETNTYIERIFKYYAGLCYENLR